MSGMNTVGKKTGRAGAIVLAAAAVLAALAACGKTAAPAGSTAAAGGGETAAAGPRIVKDGTVRTLYAGDYEHLDYCNSPTNTYTFHANLTVCTLVEYDQYGVLRPNLATEWGVSDDGLVWTFKLRDDVDWYRSDGTVYGKATARDFVDTARWMLTKANANQINQNLISALKNAREYFDGTVTDFDQVGIHALDDYTLQYTLIRPTPYFESMVTYASFYPSSGAFRAEQGASYATSNDTVLYSGAYIMTTWEPESRRVYERNDRYWNAAAYPVKVIEERYNKEASTIGPEMFLRDEIDEIGITAAILDEWIKDPAKSDLVYREPPTKYTYFYSFNFDPRYGAEYGPENWKKAVNNRAFRKSLYHGLNKSNLATTLDPVTPDIRLINTLVLSGMYSAGGRDYTQFPALKDLAATSTYDVALAQEYKAQAMEELAGQVEFPVKIVMPYPTTSPSLTNQAQLAEQQLERDLGKDYIDVITLAFPGTGYSTQTRDAGVYSFMQANWGPDYHDPMSVLDPFNNEIAVGPRYGKINLAQDGIGPDGVPVFQSLLNTANEEVLDLERRYTLFSEAEKYLLDNAYALPFVRSGYGPYASRLDPFTGFTTQDGPQRIKLAGKALLDRPYTPAEFQAAQEKFNREREAAMAAAAR